MVVKEVQIPPIDPIIETQDNQKPDQLHQILQGLIAMQAKTNETLEKLSEKIDNIIINKQNNEVKNTEDMIKQMNNTKIKERRMFKLLYIKSVLPINPLDQQLHGDTFSNGGIEWGDTNKWFDSEAEAKAYGEQHYPGKYKLLPVTVPISEGTEFKRRTFNLQM